MVCKLIDDGAMKLVDMSKKQMIGEGQYGKVYLVNYLGREYAVKQTDLHSVTDADIHRDIDFLYGYHCMDQSVLVELDFLQRFVNSQVLMSAKGICIDDNNVSVFMHPYNMNLRDYIINMPPAIRKRNFGKVFTSCLTSLAVLSEYNMAHFDIKPENILVNVDDKGDIVDIVMSDYGLSQYIYGELVNSFTRYTAYYRPPEHTYIQSSKYGNIKDVKADIKDAKAADIWALGVVFAEYIREDRLFEIANPALFNPLPNTSSWEEKLIQLHDVRRRINPQYVWFSQQHSFDIPTLSSSSSSSSSSLQQQPKFNFKGWNEDMLQFDPSKRLSAYELLNKYSDLTLFERELHLLTHYNMSITPTPNAANNWKQIVKIAIDQDLNFIVAITSFWIARRASDFFFQPLLPLQSSQSSSSLTQPLSTSQPSNDSSTNRSNNSSTNKKITSSLLSNNNSKLATSKLVTNKLTDNNRSDRNKTASLERTRKFFLTCINLASVYFEDKDVVGAYYDYENHNIRHEMCELQKQVYNYVDFVIFTEQLTPLFETLYRKYGSNNAVVNNLVIETNNILDYLYNM